MSSTNKKYTKSPFNWVGNKYKFLDTINSIIRSNKRYNIVFDMFMGSGNILLNTDCKADTYVGNDKIKLLPRIYNEIWNNEYKFNLNDIENILNKFIRFSTKESYYTFRDYWNKKYLSNNFNKEFILETILLLKMCSNSMVRFNPKEGYFNQGFRGLGDKKEFFTDSMKELCVNSINSLTDLLIEKRYEFRNMDFIHYIDEGNDNLLILDPPYSLRSDMYDTDWSKQHDKKLFNLMKNTKNDFIYFNYIERDGVINQDLIDFIKDNKLNYVDINSKTLAGQGRRENIREVKEVLITNVSL